MQVPVMYCIGSIAKKVLSLLLDGISTKRNVIGRNDVYALTLRNTTADLYFRHWRELVPASIVCDDVVGGPVHKC